MAEITKYKLSVAEYQFQTTTDAIRQEIKQMAELFADNMGIDWEFDLRWMTMTEENYLLAQIKHAKLISALKVVKI